MLIDYNIYVNLLIDNRF